MNGASEATLQELLSVNQEMASAIRSLASKSGGSGGGGGSSVEKEYKKSGVLASTFSKTLDAAGSVLSGTFSTAVNIAAAGFRGLKQTGEALMANQRALAQGAIDGTNGLASLTEGLSRLPFGLGLVADVMTYQAKKLEKNLAVYQKISDSGAMLGGNLNSVRQSAAGMYLSMDEFASVMKTNTPYLLSMGQTAEDGAKNLIRFNTTMIKGEVGRGLLNMGYSLEQANNMLGSYASSMGGITQDQMNDQRGMEKSVKAFAEELALSAALEGKSREEKEKEMKEQAANAARELMLSKMTAEEKQRYIEAENRAGMIGGKAAKDALLSTALGLPPMTKQAQIFAATQSKANDAVNDLYKTSKDGALSEEQRRAQMDKAAAKGTQAMADSAKKYGNVMNAQIMSGGAYAETMTASAKAAADSNKRGLKTEEDRVAAIEKTRAQQQEAVKKGTAGAVAQAQGAAKHMGGLMDMLAKALEPLFPIVTGLIKGFGELLPKIISIGGTVVKTLSDAFKEIFAGVSINDIIQPFKDFWKGLFGGGSGVDTKSVKDGIVNFFKPIKDFVGGFFSSIDFEGIGAKVRETFGRVFGALGKIANVFTGILGGGPDPAEAGKGFQKYFNMLMNVIGDIADIIASIVEGFTASPVFETFKTIIDKVVNIFSGVINILKEIVAGPIGTWLFKQVYNVMDLLIAPFKFMIDVIDGAIDIVQGIIQIIKGDFEGGMDKIGGAIKNLLNGMLDWFLRLPKFVLNLFGAGEWFTEITNVVKDFLGKVVDGIKDFFKSAFNIFSSSKNESKAETPTAQTAKPQTPAQDAQANTQAAIDKVANDWAYSVYTNKATLAQVPKDALAKVQDILKNPPNAWKPASGSTQQPAQNTAAKPAEKPAEKPAATPVADLNNKDALQVLKTIADYQRRTIDALNGLNGNLLKRA